jgi:hypothetical protein
LDRHPSHPSELKTKAFINGQGGWNVVPADERKAYLRSICDLAARDTELYCSALSFERYKKGVEGKPNHATRRDYWHAASMFVTSLIQKKAEKLPKNKGLTVLVMDDNKAGMPALSEAIHAPDSWFDGLYQSRMQGKKGGKWIARTNSDRFNHIVNTAFAIKSSHSSLIQVADAQAYVCRRNLELLTETEAWGGEKTYYEELVGITRPARVRIGQCPECEAVSFYEAAAPDGWRL